MNLYTYRNLYNEETKQREKIILICDAQTDPAFQQNSRRCLSGGITIWANGDGWGGGCEPVNQKSLVIAGKSKTYCSSDKGIAQLYVSGESGGTQSINYSIDGTFSTGFTSEQATAVIRSFHP